MFASPLVLDDENMTFNNIQELEMVLETQTDLDHASYKAMTSEGGYFDTAGHVATSGITDAENSRLGELHNNNSCAADAQPVGKRRKGNTGTAITNGTATGGTGSGRGQGSAPTGGDAPTAVGKGSTPTGVLVTKKTGAALASSSLKELSSKIAEAQRLVLDCGIACGSPSLISEINGAIKAMHEQHVMLESWVIKKVENPPNFYDAMIANAGSQMTFCSDRMDYAKALVQVTKRKEKAASGVADAAAKAAAAPAAAGA